MTEISDVEIIIDPVGFPDLNSWRDDFLNGIARSFGLSYEQIAANYEATLYPPPQLRKAEALIRAAGSRGALGYRGMGRKLKRAVRLERKYRGRAYSHASIMMRYDQAFMKSWSNRVLGDWYAEFWKNTASIKPDDYCGWHGLGRPLVWHPGRLAIDPVTVA